MNNLREVKGRRRMPRPVPLMMALLSLGMLAIVTLGAGQINIPGWVLLVVQVLWLVATGVIVIRAARFAIYDLRDDRRTLGEQRWRTARGFAYSALIFGVLAIMLAFILLLRPIIPSLADALSLIAYIIGAGGLGLTIMTVAGLIADRNDRRERGSRRR